MKSKKNYLFGFFFLLLNLANAKGQDCDCKKNAEYLIAKIEANYAGFVDKVNPGTKSQYESFRNKIIDNAEGVSDIRCFDILTKYVLWFKDQHLSVSISTRQKKAEQIEAFYAKSNRSYVDTTKFLNGKYQFKDFIEGIWELKTPSTFYRVLIFREGKISFTGVVLNGDNLFWKPFQIKIKAKKIKMHKYLVRYFLQTHDFVIENVEICNQSEMYLFGNRWSKVYPEVKIRNGETDCVRNRSFLFECISPNTCRLVLPSFAISNAGVIDSIIKLYDSVIRSKKNLIIDIRNNSGGWTGVANFLLPYFYTNPIKYEETIYKSSDDIIEYYKEKNKDTAISEYYHDQNIRLISRLELNKGKLVTFEPPGVYQQGVSLSYPQKIAVLINGNCMSAAEMFTLVLKQSTKTIVFGENSRGVVDYGNVRSNLPMPCSFFQFGYPIVKRGGAVKAPIDNIGIRPDVLLTGPENEWLKKVVSFLENN
jgi:hypothetical protein